jgi:hypothetical protein
MPDPVNVFAKRWKFIVGLTIIATVIAFISAELSPRKYLSTATALPANTAVGDKARIFNNNIEALYSDLGSPDDLDRLEGTASLDTIYIATAHDLNLIRYYNIRPSEKALYKAALQLKHSSDIRRTGYGELEVKAWDGDEYMAAKMANMLLQKLQQLHQHLQSRRTAQVLQKIKDDYAIRQKQYKQVADTIAKLSGTDAEIEQAKKAALFDQLQQYEKLVDQYQLALNSSPEVLLIIENARPAIKADRPRIMLTVLVVLFGSFLFAFLLALFLESRNEREASGYKPQAAS